MSDCDAIFFVEAILFDMDGTLVNSTTGVVGAWEVFRQSYPHIDVDKILSTSHGVRTIDNLRTYLGIQDPEILEKEAERFEKAIVSTASADGRPGLVLLPGVKTIVEELASSRFLPSPSWAICTSATRAYATSALFSTGVPLPDVFVTSEDVKRGKPHPDPYILGAQKCGLKPENCVVFEDAPSGIHSGRRAGCKTIGLLTTHSREQIEAAQPDFIVKDLSCVSIKRSDSGVVTVTIKSDDTYQDI